MKESKKILLAILLVIAAGIYYYVTIPAINIHSADTWGFAIILLLIILAVYIVRKRMHISEIKESKCNLNLSKKISLDSPFNMALSKSLSSLK